MLPYFLDKHIVGISKVLEGVLTGLHWFVLLSTICFWVLTIQGVPFRPESTGELAVKYRLVLCAAILEVLITCVQRLVLKIADPYPLSRLEKALSPPKARRRMVFRTIVLPVIFVLTIGIIDSCCKRRWLLSHEDLPLIQFVCGMNFMIPFFSLTAKQIHRKFWTMAA